MIHTQLRQVIRNLITEVYKGFDDTVPGPEATREEQSLWDIRGRDRRAMGTQTSSEILSDREKMQAFQARLQPDLRNAFMNADITTMHSIAYDAVMIDSGKKVKTFTDWLKTHNNNRHQISCIAYNEPVGTPPKRLDVGPHRNPRVYLQYGFVMKGYPAYISTDDAASQSHSLVPPELLKHQEQSGLAKRSADIFIDLSSIASFDQFDEFFGWAGEVFLDNWRPVACYIHEKYETQDRIQDAKATGLPVYIINRDTWKRL